MIETDKKQHFIMCGFAALLIGLINPIYGVCFGAGIGIGKEYGDSKAVGNTWSWSDLAADFLGVLAGVLIALALRFIGGYLYG